MELYAPVLHIPEAVNFDCTGCGNCCFTWPVPATAADVDRITALSNADQVPRFKKFAQKSDDKLRGFTHFLGKDERGDCQYLDNLRCSLHAKHGSHAKPAMCQLFPYTFTLTPTGAYASLSFASTGVLLNHGTPLSQQRAFLEDRLALFLCLFPGEPDWSRIQLIDGIALTWIDYLLIERKLLATLHPNNSTANGDDLVSCSAQILGSTRVDLEHEKMIKAPPPFMDTVFTLLLMEMYFPDNAFNDNVCNFDTTKLVKLLSNQSSLPKFQFDRRQFDLQELSGIKVGGISKEADELLGRFMYCRIFAKLYFGPGFNGLSLLSGFHHLFLLSALCRLRLKMRICCGSKEDELMDCLREDLRLMERRLTVTSLSQEAQAAMEVLLQGPQRTKRIVMAAS